MSFVNKRKILYNKNGKLALVQIGSKFYKLVEERDIELDINQLVGILNNNDVYLLRKGD